MKGVYMLKFKKCFIYMLAFIMTLSLTPAKTDAAQKVRISKSSMTLYVGNTANLMLRNNSKKVKWWSTNKSVATVTQKGVVKAKSSGRCRIAAKVASKKYVCKVTVKKKTSSAKRSGTYVYITNTGSKYHRGTCRYLWNSKIKISLSSAKAQGYTACSVCY